MPTGYTYDIPNGITFTQYALGCARAFGAFMHLRDEGSDAPLTLDEAPSTYHQEALAEAEKDLLEFQTLEPLALRDRWVQEHLQGLLDVQKSIDNKVTLKWKYEAMLDKAQAWVPPTEDHKSFKAFMIKQIQDSIGYDCDVEYYVNKLQTPQEDFALWVERNLKSLRRNIEYHTKEAAHEATRKAERDKWALDLRGALVHGSCIAALSQEGTHVLMIERKEAPGKFGLVGGTVEPGEWAFDTANREFEEETGLDPANFHGPLAPIVSSMDDYGHLTNTYLLHCTDDIIPHTDFVGPEGRLIWVALADMASETLTPFPQYNQKVLRAIQGEHHDAFDPRV